jgi:hypothetical protein
LLATVSANRRAPLNSCGGNQADTGAISRKQGGTNQMANYIKAALIIIRLLIRFLMLLHDLGDLQVIVSLHRFRWWCRECARGGIFCHHPPSLRSVQKNFAVGLRNACAG